MTVEDYNQVYSLWVSCKGMGLNNLDDSKEGIERFLKRNPETCFVMEQDCYVIGAIMAGNDGRRGYIYHTAVRDEYRRQRVGQKLVSAVMNAFKDCGINKVALVIFETNAVGGAFWEKMGFTVRKDIDYRNREINKSVRSDT